MSALRHRRIARSTVAAAAGVVGLTSAAAAAATLAVTSGALGAGSASTIVCPTAGVSLTQTVSSAKVASVTVGSIPSACGGGKLYVTVYDGTTVGTTGAQTIPAGGGTMSAVAVSPQPNASASNQSSILIQGP
jgi:hypothetical protein